MEPGEAEPPAPIGLLQPVKFRMPPRPPCFASSYPPFLCVFVVFAGKMSDAGFYTFPGEDANAARANSCGRSSYLHRSGRHAKRSVAPRRSRSILHHLPQRKASHCRSCSGQAGCHAPQLECRDLGTRHRKAAGRFHASAGKTARPDTATYRAVATWLENEIDRAWTAN